ncbi:hypothetical protein AB1A64_10670 [Ruegeria sp. ANG10]|uniref:hypothetical protein n=1 Tax=Ruegeria sp. ANG10 TaxID=3042467 RepID=UPI003456E58B
MNLGFALVVVHFRLGLMWVLAGPMIDFGCTIVSLHMVFAAQMEAKRFGPYDNETACADIIRNSGKGIKLSSKYNRYAFQAKGA